MSEINFDFNLQPKQWEFFSTDVDIGVFGGAAGGGKSHVLETIPVQYVHMPGFNAVIFRRESPEITNPGGLWDLSYELYLPLGAVPKQTDFSWDFWNKSLIKFSHMQREKDRFKHKGGQYVMVGFDEVDSFTEKQFWYILSRMRSTSGVKPILRATCNPDSDSWVAKLIDWYIDQDTGYAINERSGVVRWFLQRGEGVAGLEWFDSKEEALEKYPKSRPKSFTFIVSKVEDNQILLDKNPEYLSNLEALGLVERERLLNGNWKIRPAAGLYFQRSYFKTISKEEFDKTVPKSAHTVRYWDLASSKEKQKTSEAGQPCRTAGVKMCKHDGIYYIIHVEKFRESPLVVEERIKNIAALDTQNCFVAIEEDPGQAGIALSEHYRIKLANYATLFPRPTLNKVARASPLSAQAEGRKVVLVEGPWIEDFITEAESFPESKFKDQIDAASGAFNALNKYQETWVA